MKDDKTTEHDGKAVTKRSTFSRETSVAINIKAEPSVVWSLLTNAGDYSRWDTTVISIEGKIALGEKIKLRSTLAPEKTFKLTVKEVEEGKKLVWGDAMGQRTYTLSKNDSGTNFSMNEKIGGPLFPLFARMIPPFDKAFEQFAADLKKEAEALKNSK